MVDIEVHSELAAYLAERGWDQARKFSSRLLTGGVSNRTVLVTFDDGSAWVLKQALAKLRVAAEWHCDPSRILREAAALEVMSALAPPGAVPRLIFLDHEAYIRAM